MTTAEERRSKFNVGDAPSGDPGTPESEPWDLPSPIVAEALPPFPTEAFPDWLRDYVDALSIATQTPVDLAAMLALAAIATGAQKRIIVRPRDGWSEPVNVWCAIAQESGSRKSPVVAAVMQPLMDFERAEAERVKPEIAEAIVRQQIAQKELAKVQDKAAKEPNVNEHEGLARKAIELQRRITDTRIPVALRLSVDDATPERLTALMAEQEGRMAVLSAEPEIFEQIAGKYQGTPAFNVFLKAHAGDDLRVDRVGRAPDYVRSPALTMGLAMQPSVIFELAQRPGWRGRGLLARFFYSHPQSMVGRRDVNPPPVPDEIRATYHQALWKIMQLEPEPGEDGESYPHIVRLDAAAHDILLAFASALEPTLAEHGQFGFMADWASKLAGGVVRVSGLLHVADLAPFDIEPWSEPIPAQTMDRARFIGSYLASHAVGAMKMMGADESTADARWILGWLTKSELCHFSARDCHRAGQTRFRNVAALDAPLRLLTDHGYIRRRLILHAGPGRPPSPIFDINPRLNEEVRA